MKIDPIPYSLEYYTQRARGRSVADMRHAVEDIQRTLPLYRERSVTDPYVAKLLAEMDSYTTEMMLRARKRERRK